MEPRPAAMRPQDVPPDLRAALSRGEVASRNLGEMLAVDFNLLLSSILPNHRPDDVDFNLGIVQRMQTAGQYLAASCSPEQLNLLATHPSDTVRGWVCYALLSNVMSPEKALELVRPFADDSHSGVREWAWMAARPSLVTDLAQSFALLTIWAQHSSANLRRFASEVTRPRGVWCAHIPALKQNLLPGFALLENLRNDPHKYVQDSVANWLNDASKTHPDAVRDLTTAWQTASPTPATLRICKRALRTVHKSLDKSPK